MATSGVVLHLAGGFVALAVVLSAATVRAAGNTNPRSDLEVLLRRTVFFGHQSVGVNILDGVADLARQEGLPYRIVESKSAAATAAGSWAHGFIAENGNPALKIQSFVRMFDSVAGDAPDIAMMKFCYVDFVEGTNVQELFASYRAALEGLRARNPSTTFVHFTVPLTTVPGGLKGLARRLLGRHGSEAQNARRAEFNALMRQAYLGKEPLFDLAGVESVAPDGRPVTIEWEGKSIPVLFPAYSDDGGHLNVDGRRRVARELVAHLASLPPIPRAARAK